MHSYTTINYIITLKQLVLIDFHYKIQLICYMPSTLTSTHLEHHPLSLSLYSKNDDLSYIGDFLTAETSFFNQFYIFSASFLSHKFIRYFYDLNYYYQTRLFLLTCDYYQHN